MTRLIFKTLLWVTCIQFVLLFFYINTGHVDISNQHTENITLNFKDSATTSTTTTKTKFNITSRNTFAGLNPNNTANNKTESTPRILKMEDLEFLCSHKSHVYENPLLTLMTTVKDWRPRRTLHLNTFRNWRRVSASINTVLFLCSSHGEEFSIHHACHMGWHVFELPQGSCNGGSPLIKDLFNYGRILSRNSSFYGYSNADILYDETLTKTLEFLKSHEKTVSADLVVGCRINAKIRGGRIIDSLAEVRQIASSCSSDMSYPHAIDYFISPGGGGFPWSTIPPLVVGRRAYDNWLMFYALQKLKLSVIDATETLLAMHQNHTYIQHVRNNATYRDVNIPYVQKDLKKRNYYKSFITCAPYKVKLAYQQMQLAQRKTKPQCNRVLVPKVMKRNETLIVLVKETVDWFHLVLDVRQQKSLCPKVKSTKARPTKWVGRVGVSPPPPKEWPLNKTEPATRIAGAKQAVLLQQKQQYSQQQQEIDRLSTINEKSIGLQTFKMKSPTSLNKVRKIPSRRLALEQRLRARTSRKQS